MQVTAGVQRYGCVFGLNRLGCIRRQHVLLPMRGGQVVALAQLLAAGDQGWIVFQAGQLLVALQQASTQVTFTGAPVQPVSRLRGEVQATGEGFNLLPFAARYIDVETVD